MLFVSDEEEEEAIPGREALTFDIDDLKEHSDSRMYFDLLMLNPIKLRLTFNLSHANKTYVMITNAHKRRAA